jgi:HlyD family secretion protein
VAPMTTGKGMDPNVLPDTSRQDRVLEKKSSWVRHRAKVFTAFMGVVALGVVLAAALHFRGMQNSVDESRLAIATVERGSFVRDIAADGQVIAAVSPTLYAVSAGNVTLKVHAGDPVKKNDLLAVVDSPDLNAKLGQEESTFESLQIDWRRAQLVARQKLSELQDYYTQAQIDQKTAQREVERSQKAHDLGAYSELQVLKTRDSLEKSNFALEQAKAKYDSQPEQNRFDIDSRKAALDRQKVLLTDLRRQVAALEVRSPVDGRVGQVLISDHASVAKDAPILSVIDLSALEVEIHVPESLARDLAPGMAADLAGDGRTWKASVSAVSPQVINGEVIARLRFAAEKPAGLRQSQRLSARILIDRREHVLMVDRGPFLEQDGGGFVYLVHDGIAERHPVVLGATSLQKVEIVSGLREGEKVVISGTDTFRGAQRIALVH